jgi:hypothetical protein
VASLQRRGGSAYPRLLHAGFARDLSAGVIEQALTQSAETLRFRNDAAHRCMQVEVEIETV